MKTSNSAPSFWSGVAASEYFFEDTADYSSWACGLLESGYDSKNICVLAGLFDENNLFELRLWHSRALGDLGFGDINPRARFLAHLRGYAEEFLDGKRDFRDITQHFHELQMDKDDELLCTFDALHYGFWDFAYMDMSELGISSMDDFPRATTEACHNLLSRIKEGEQVGAGDAEEAV